MVSEWSTCACEHTIEMDAGAVQEHRKSVAEILDVHLMALRMSKKTINHISESVRTFPEMIKTWGHWLNVLIHRWIHTLNRLSVGGRTVETEPGWRKPVGVALGAVSYPGPFFWHSAMLVGRYSIKGSVLLHPPHHGEKLWNHELKWIFPLLFFFFYGAHSSEKLPNTCPRFYR